MEPKARLRASSTRYGGMRGGFTVWHDPGFRCAPSGLRTPQQRLRIAGEAADGAQRHMADDTGDAEGLVVDQRARELLVGGEGGADEAGEIVDGATHLPALDHLLDGGEALLEATAGGVLLGGG